MYGVFVNNMLNAYKRTNNTNVHKTRGPHPVRYGLGNSGHDAGTTVKTTCNLTMARMMDELRASSQATLATNQATIGPEKHGLYQTSIMLQAVALGGYQ